MPLPEFMFKAKAVGRTKSRSGSRESRNRARAKTEGGAFPRRQGQVPWTFRLEGRSEESGVQVEGSKRYRRYWPSVWTDHP